MSTSDEAIRKVLRPDSRLSDLCRHVSGKTGKSPVRRAAKEAPKTRAPSLPSYKDAKAALLGAFLAKGWELSSPHLKVPHVTSADGKVRFWLKPQTVLISRGAHTLASAKNTGIDMRQPGAFEKLCALVVQSKKLPSAAKPDKPGAFSRTVLRAVKDVPPSGRFGQRKVFISEAFQKYKRHGGTVPNLLEFQRILGHANRKGELQLVRADLVGAMDPDKVRDSEMQYLNATYHFIIDPQ